MNFAHVHLAVCHVPVVGQFFAAGALLIAVLRKDESFRRWVLGFAVFAALTALPASWSGEKAEDAVQGRPGVSMDAMETHEEAAEGATAGTLAAGGLAALALIAGFFRPGLARPAAAAALLASLVAAGLLGRAANLGGLISHPEIRADAARD